MTVEELLMPRYEVVGDYPNCSHLNHFNQFVSDNTMS